MIGWIGGRGAEAQGAPHAVDLFESSGALVDAVDGDLYRLIAVNTDRVVQQHSRLRVDGHKVDQHILVRAQRDRAPAFVHQHEVVHGPTRTTGNRVEIRLVHVENAPAAEQRRRDVRPLLAGTTVSERAVYHVAKLARPATRLSSNVRAREDQSDRQSDKGEQTNP